MDCIGLRTAHQVVTDSGYKQYNERRDLLKQGTLARGAVETGKVEAYICRKVRAASHGTHHSSSCPNPLFPQFPCLELAWSSMMPSLSDPADSQTL